MIIGLLEIPGNGNESDMDRDYSKKRREVDRLKIYRTL